LFGQKFNRIQLAVCLSIKSMEDENTSPPKFLIITSGILRIIRNGSMFISLYHNFKFQSS